MASRLDKVKTGVYAIVYDFLTVNAIFLLKVCVVSRLDVLHYRFPTKTTLLMTVNLDTGKD